MKAPKPKGDYLNIMCPPGLKPAVLVDVHDEGEHEDEWQGIRKLKPKVSLHFLLAETIPAVWTNPQTNEAVNVQELKPELVGRQFGISRWFTFSMYDQAALRQFVQAWLGVEMTDDEAWDFDLESLINRPAYLNIIHKRSQDGTKWYNKIHSALPLPAEIPIPQIPVDYKRRRDRDNDDAPVAQPAPAVALAGNVNGRGPDADFTGEPIPTEGTTVPDDDLPFMRMP